MQNRDKQGSLLRICRTKPPNVIKPYGISSFFLSKHTNSYMASCEWTEIETCRNKKILVVGKGKGRFFRVGFCVCVSNLCYDKKLDEVCRMSEKSKVMSWNSVSKSLNINEIPTLKQAHQFIRKA
jgi:hypothetical protein